MAADHDGTSRNLSISQGETRKPIKQTRALEQREMAEMEVAHTHTQWNTVTEQWGKVVRRMSVEVPRTNPVAWFEERRQERGWKYSTTLTYVEAYLANHPKPTRHRQQLADTATLWRYVKALRAHARVETSRAARGITTREVAQLNPTQSRKDLLLFGAFALGQRPSDFAQIATKDIGTIELDGDSFLIVTMRRTKTAKATGPYSLHIPRGSLLAQALEQRKRRCMEKNRYFVFIKGPTKQGLGGILYPTLRNRNAMMHACATRLKQISRDLEIRSIRRGGLQRLAQIGFSIDEIRSYFSKHTTSASLNTYLAFGAHSIQQARAHSQAVEPQVRNLRWRTSRQFFPTEQQTRMQRRQTE